MGHPPSEPQKGDFALLLLAEVRRGASTERRPRDHRALGQTRQIHGARLEERSLNRPLRFRCHANLNGGIIGESVNKPARNRSLTDRPARFQRSLYRFSFTSALARRSFSPFYDATLAAGPARTWTRICSRLAVQGWGRERA